MIKTRSKDRKPHVSIISVNFNGAKWLKGFLNSSKKQKGVVTELIIVDNNSTDESLKLVGKLFTEAKIIKNKSNIGFGRANNQGAIEATGEVLLFLNTDVEIPKPNFVHTMYKHLIKNRVCILGPKIINFDGEDPTFGKKQNIDIFSYPGLSNNSFYVDGCALMIRKKDFLSLGAFDEKYFMYGEDIDLSWRARLMGKKVEIFQGATIKHFGGGSCAPTHTILRTKHKVPEFRRYEVEKNSLRNIIKNYSFLSLILIVPLYCILNMSESLLYLVVGKQRLARKIFSSLWWNIVNITDTLKERSRVQKSRKVGDLSILRLMSFFPNKIVTFIHIGIPKFV